MNLLMPDWAAKWALYSPDQIALKEHETQRSLTYGQLNQLAMMLASHLRESYGIQKGDRVAVLANNCLEYVILFTAAQKNGMILVPLNYRLSKGEMDFLIKNSSPKLLIVSELYKSLISDNATVEYRWPLAELRSYCQVSKLPNIPVHFDNVALQADDPVLILFTSGTTGFPKGAIYSHQMLFWNSIDTSMSLLINTESRTINCAPPFHTGGWNVLLTPFLHHGAYTYLIEKFDAPTILELLEKEKPSLFFGVPTMLKMIAEEATFDQTDLSSLHYIIVGGEPMPIPLIEQWHQKGVYIRQGYGMTEVGPNLTSLHQRDAIRKKGSIGRPNFYVQTKIVDEQGKEVGPNIAGELLLKGPMVTPGYWQNPEATQKAIQEAWFHTGDMVQQDEEGYFYVVDRIKNMFISGGENIYPAEVERILCTHPNISAAAVVPIPHHKWGEVGKAYYVSYNQETIPAEDLKAFCLEKLAKFKIPKAFKMIKALPLGSSGKIDRRALSDYQD